MRIATYNIEWFAGLFDPEDRLLLDDKPARRGKTTRAGQAQAIADVLRAVDADLVVIVEAPNTGRSQSTPRALMRFATQFNLRQRAAVMGFENGTTQELATLYDPKIVQLRHDPVGAPFEDGTPDPAPRFDTSVLHDVDGDGRKERFVFSKPPVELAMDAPRKLRLIGVHVKSKAPHGASSEAEATAISIANRRKQLAQCVWLRRRVEAHLGAGEDVIVLGDFNDGPGLDAYEALFGQSSVEVVLAPDAAPQMRLVDPHAMVRVRPRQGWTLSSARFWNEDLQSHVGALLDYVMLSHGLAEQATWRIWHPFDRPECYE
ncbi:MAG: endonuclease/exonuclease/phosphatase family protein, partial [Pseudomonadota bacterium]